MKDKLKYTFSLPAQSLFLEPAWVEEQTVIYVLAFTKEFVGELASSE